MHNPSNNACPKNADPRNESCACVPAPQRRAIDSDIDFYSAEVEYCVARKRRCAIQDEDYWQKRADAAHEAVRALRALRDAIDRN